MLHGSFVNCNLGEKCIAAYSFMIIYTSDCSFGAGQSCLCDMWQSDKGCVNHNHASGKYGTDVTYTTLATLEQRFPVSERLPGDLR